jgi:hypothetical protein
MNMEFRNKVNSLFSKKGTMKEKGELWREIVETVHTDYECKKYLIEKMQEIGLLDKTITHI